MGNDAVLTQRERFNRALQHRLATCGDRTYPAEWAVQDIISLLHGDMDTEADEPHHWIEEEQETLRMLAVGVEKP